MELITSRGWWLRIAAFLFLTCATAPVAHGQVAGYLVVSQDLFERDLVTLDSSLIGPTGSITSGGLAMRSDGILVSASHFTDDLWRIDPVTGVGTLIGSLGIDVTVDSGLTFDACGNLWLGSRTGILYEVDHETAATTEVANFDPGIIGLTARGDRLLALVELGPSNRLAWINPSEGSMELFGDLVNIPTFQGGLDFDEDGGLWGMFWVDSPIPVPWVSSIVRFDPTTGQILGVAADIGPPVAGNLAISPPEGVCGSPFAVPSSSPLARLTLILILVTAGFVMVRGAR